ILLSDRRAKIYMSSVPFYLLAVLAPPPLAATAAGVGALLGELSVRAQRGNLPGDIASEVGRRVLVVLLGALVANLPLASALPTALVYLSLRAIVQAEDAQHAAEDRKQVAERRALHDALTGLPNRTLLFQRAEQAVHVAQRGREPLALLLLDLDHFKDVNDTLGHYHGDLVLQEVAARLCHALRESDVVARLDGDEFAALLPGA